MAVTTRFPTANAAYSGAGFSNPGNLHADDGVYGTSAPAKNGGLGNVYQNFGFDGVIPANSTIDAVKIIYEFKVSTTGSVAVQRVKARISAVEEENHDNTNEPTSDTAVTVDITTDRTWARSDLLDGTFEVIAEPRRGNTNTAYTASWDYVKVEVTYTPPANRRGLVSWAELEIPDVDRRLQVSFAELEVPNAPRRFQVSWAELEIPDAPRRLWLSFAELEVPNWDRRLLIAYAELETGDAPGGSEVEPETKPCNVSLMYAFWISNEVWE